MTSLHVAVEGGYLETVKCLANNEKADISIKDKKGVSILGISTIHDATLLLTIGNLL